MEESQQETKDESSKTEESDIEEKSVEIGCRSDDLETVVLNEVFTAENDSKENLLEQIETPSEAESSQINPSKNPVDAEGEVIVANIPENEANIDPKEEGKDEGESLQVEETKKEEIPFLVNRLEDLKVYNEDELQKLYLEAVIKFNIKPKSVRQFLISKKLIQGFPSEIAQFIQKNPKISKRRLGEYIGNPDEFQQLVCDELFKLYDFKNRTLDHALRLLLLQFRLPGEAQQIDRILEKFAQHYFLQNPNIFLSSDTAYVLSFSLIMLNTDLHNQSIIPEKKMTLDQFIKNNRGINQGKDIPSEILITLYNSVKENEIRMEETDMYESEVVAFMAPTKSGWLSKQTDNYLLEMSLWKRYWFVLNDGCLYYFTDPSDEGPTCIIPLDNTKPLKGKGSELDLILTSSVSGDHIKSSKVLADGRMEQGRHKQLLFRCESVEERDSWVKVLQEESLRFKPLHEIFLRRREEVNPIEVMPIVVPRAPLAEGWMRERWNIPKISWKRRYMVLYPDFDGEGDTIFYYVSQQLAVRMKEFGTQTQQGYIRMKELKSLELVSPPKGFTFIQLTTDDNRSLQLIPDDPEQLDLWYDTLYSSLSSLNIGSASKSLSPGSSSSPKHSAL